MIARRAGGPASARVVAAAPRSVAVLPVVDMSAGGENAYLGDGLADELIAALGRVEGLSVAARTSSFALRDARLDVRTIADTLGVAAVVEGSVRRAGDRVRVTAQLVDARSGYRLWSEEYDLEVHDALAVQEEIATAIAGALRLTMDPAAGASHGRTANREAWNLYLHANFLRNRLARTELLKALENFDRAIALDSSFARAWSGKAQTLVTLVHLRGVPRDSGLAAARAAALRAMALDDRLAEPHATLGAMSMGLAWDWPAAGRELRRAIEVEPSDAFSHNVLANYYRIMGRQDLALVERQRAAALDPLNPRIAVGLGGDYYAMGQYERALAQFRRSADLDSMSSHLLGTGPRLPGAVGQVLERLGREDEAVDWYVSVARRRGAAPGEQDALRRAHATGGMRAFWHAWLAFDRRTAKVDDTRPLREAAILARAGDVDAAIPVLERAYAERDPALIYIGVEEPWVALRDDPRIASIRRRMKLPE
jgi:serine/threonine-protein kinase